MTRYSPRADLAAWLRTLSAELLYVLSAFDAPRTAQQAFERLDVDPDERDDFRGIVEDLVARAAATGRGTR